VTDRTLGLVELRFPTPDVLGHLGKAAAAGLPVGVGTVVPPVAVEAGAWSEITERARAFAAARTARRER
jgi:hypothetical protein